MLRALAVLALLLATPTPAAPQQPEEILSYDVHVEVEDGNHLLVTEEITVRALGREIQRGIYRDFPTSFPRVAGLGRIEAPFEVLEVRRDGEPEPWVLERIGAVLGTGGARVRIGDADVYLEPGVYRYTIRYQTWRWIHYGDERDALYWNVTGNGWDFPIGEATARVTLPRPTDESALTMEAWTGPEGSTSSAAEHEWDASSNAALFRTTRPLGPREGLTIRVAMPKGVVEPPPPAVERSWFRMDWGGYLDAAAAVGLVLALYMLLWARVGRDPRAGPVVVRYEPPQGYSPAALGFLKRRGYHPSQLAAALVNLGVHGALTIERGGGTWSLRKGDPPNDAPGVSAEERTLFERLLGARATLELENRHATLLQGAIKQLRSALARRLEAKYFVLNRRWFAAGVVISLLGFGVLAWRDRYGIPPEGWFLGLWLTFWTLGTGTLVYRVWLGWKAALGGAGPAAWGQAMFITLFSLPFVGAELFVAVLLLTLVPQWLVLSAIALGAINVLFYHLLERPTLRGRGVLDQVAGFERFLTAAEGDRLDRMNAPARTPELFERYLPHAIALGVENRWAESFQGALSPEAVAAGGVAASSGALAWYSGGGTSDLGGLASSLGTAFSNSLSSASSPPPSSGGSGGGGGGGGSSGGGGGGGGGGGW